MNLLVSPRSNTSACVIAAHLRDELPAFPLALMPRRWGCFAEQIAIPACLCTLRPEGTPRPAMTTPLAQVAQKLDGRFPKHFKVLGIPCNSN